VRHINIETSVHIYTVQIPVWRQPLLPGPGSFGLAANYRSVGNWRQSVNEVILGTAMSPCFCGVIDSATIGFNVFDGVLG